MPGVAYRVRSAGGKTAEIIVCYECHMLRVLATGKWVNFDPANKPLVALAKKVFPDDAAIKALK